MVLVIRHCVNTTEAKMETAHSVEEDGREVDVSVGCKAEGKSMAITQKNCFLLLTLAAMHTHVGTNVDGYFW